MIHEYRTNLDMKSRYEKGPENCLICIASAAPQIYFQMLGKTHKSLLSPDFKPFSQLFACIVVLKSFLRREIGKLQTPLIYINIA